MSQLTAISLGLALLFAGLFQIVGGRVASIIERATLALFFLAGAILFGMVALIASLLS